MRERVRRGAGAKVPKCHNSIESWRADLSSASRDVTWYAAVTWSAVTWMPVPRWLREDRPARGPARPGPASSYQQFVSTALADGQAEIRQSGAQ